jgi:biofilm PGA synthesis N-glycosyltransferase PgaC
MMTLPTYVLITPAHNEAQFISLAIKSVVTQTVPPIKWVIVSDGSTDGTDDIVRSYANDFPWIELVRVSGRSERHFAGKVHAFNAGQARVETLDYDIIGNLDADISFGQDYIANLLSKFAENPRLGVAGTAYQERNSPYDYRFASDEYVPGACQLFRRQCFKEIGGYAPIKGGLVDSVASVSAMMKGWQTRTFTDRMCVHHRESGTAQSNILTVRFRRGAKSYAIGNHPIWELLRAPYQMTKRPFIIGSLMQLSGYFWSIIRRAERPVSREFVTFVRREQMRRLRRILIGNWPTGNEPLQHSHEDAKSNLKALL